MIANADPSQLLALAGYFEHQARWLRIEAKHIQERLNDNASARDRYTRARAAQLRTGARIAVLARRYGHREAAISEMRNRTGDSRETVMDALTAWNKEKARRKIARRNVDIYNAAMRGDTREDIARHHGITARQVRGIVAEVRAHLSVPPRGQRGRNPFNALKRAHAPQP